MQATWWSLLAALAPLTDMCGEAPDVAPARKIVEAPRVPVTTPAAPDGARETVTPTGAPARPLLRTCPPQTWPARFAGQLAGLAWVSSEDGTANLTAAATGARPAGPDPLLTLTVVRADGTLQFADPERTVHPADARGRASVTLKFPLPDRAGDNVVLVTTACLPNADARLRAWTYTPLTPIAPTFDQYKARLDAHIRDRMRPGDRNAWERRGGVPPAGLGVFATKLPGCPTLLTVNADLATRLAYDFVSAVLCVGDDGVFIDVMAPKRGRFLRWVGVADLDGDGVEEAVVHSQTHNHAGQTPRTSTTELLYRDGDALKTLQLGHIAHLK